MFRCRQTLPCSVDFFSREMSDTNLPVCIFITFFFVNVDVCKLERFLSHFQYNSIRCLPIRHRIYLITVDNWCATFCYQLWISGISPSFSTIRWWQNGIHIYAAVEKKVCPLCKNCLLHYITLHSMWCDDFTGMRTIIVILTLRDESQILLACLYILFIKNKKKNIYEESRVLFYVWKLCIKWYKFCAGFFF